MIIIDDFIKDEALLDEIANDENFFGPNGRFMWWDGWWNSPTDTLKKELSNKYLNLTQHSPQNSRTK